MSSSTSKLLSLKLRALNGTEYGPFEVKDTEKVQVVAQCAKEQICKAGNALVALSWRGAPLIGGSTLAGVGLEDGAVLDFIQVDHRRPFMVHGRHDMLPFRRAREIAHHSDGHVLDFSGCRDVQVPVVLGLLSAMPMLQVVDIRQCRLQASETEKIFAELPPGVAELRFSRNRISGSGLAQLASKSPRLRVLDIGYSDCDDLTLLPHLVGQATEELGLGQLDFRVCLELLEEALSRCPRLRKLDVCGINSVCDKLSRYCPEVQVVLSGEVERDLSGFLAKCRHLQELFVGVDSPRDLEPLSAMSLDVLMVSCQDAKVLEIVSKIKACVLHLQANYFDEDLGNGAIQWCKNVETVEAGERLAVEALTQAAAHAVSLVGLPILNEAMLEAVGPRLQVLDVADADSDWSTLGLLAQVPECCVNLVVLKIRYWEQIDSQVLALVAAACPHLEHLELNADTMDFQETPIDEGVLALGEHCHKLRWLDLYDRIMRDAPGTLAKACKGWPKLTYLCAANTLMGEDETWAKADPHATLPKALAMHCPDLVKLEIFLEDCLSLWYDILAGGCPLIKRFGQDDDDDYDD